MLIRVARSEDAAAIWSVIGPTIRARETYALDPQMAEAVALAYWLGAGKETFVAEEDGSILGTTTFAKIRPAAALTCATAAT